MDAKTKARVEHEIHKSEKKLAKLLARRAAGKKCWRLGRKGSKEELTKKQGIAPGSARHQKLQAHIDSLKALVK